MKNIMKYKNYYGKVEYSDEDQCFFGVIIGINDCVSFEGQSIDELHTSFEEAVDDYLQMCIRIKKEPEKTYKGSFNVRINRDLHRKAALLATSSGMTLNKFVESAILQKVEKLYK